MAKNTITCLISGKSFTFAKEYYGKKISEYKDEDSLKRYFVTKKVKSLICRGYSVQEIRNILNVTEDGLPSPDAECIRDIVDYHKMIHNADTRKNISQTNFATHKTDSDVVDFINNIKNITL